MRISKAQFLMEMRRWGYSRVLVAVALASGFTLNAQTFTDGFEAATLDPYWTIIQGPGTATLTNSEIHSGSEALQLTSTSSFPSNAAIAHDYGSDLSSGSFSVWMQGSQLCCYSGAAMQLHNSAGDGYVLIQQDGNNSTPSNFVVRVGRPGLPENDFQFTATAADWHLVEYDVSSGGVTFKFDGAAIFTDPSFTTFRYVYLTIWGGYGGTAYYDDFGATVNTSQYNLCFLYDPTKSVHSGSTLPVKLQLCDGTGNNLSSPTIALHSLSLTQTSSVTYGPVQAPGNANPDNDFRYDSSLGS